MPGPSTTTSEHEQLQAAIVAASDDALMVVGVDGTVLAWNPGAERTFGYTAGEMVGRSVFVLVPEGSDEEREARDLVARVLAGERVGRFDTRRLQKDGHLIDVSASAAPIVDARGKIVALACSAHDVTERKEAERELERLRSLLADAQTVAGLGSWEWDIAADEVRWSDELYRIYGVDPLALAPSYERFLGFIHPDDREGAQAEIQLAFERCAGFAFTHRLIRSGGAVRTVSCTGQVIAAPDGRPIRMVGTCQDVTELVANQKRLQELADRDPLTGLLNRRRLGEDLARHVAHIARYGGASALLALDLDRFKLVNDRAGHAAGDRMLARVASALREALRETDLIARLGGDEFVILLPESDDPSALHVAGKLLAAIRDMPRAGDDLHMTASIGITTFAHSDGRDRDGLLEAVDAALYRAKRGGRDRAST
jgi:diguanylate cyclase (GGDEF)-like protein/PAS domain S-box-containing protein